MKKIILYLFAFLLLESIGVLIVRGIIAGWGDTSFDFKVQAFADILVDVKTISYGMLFSGVLVILVFGLCGWTKNDLKKAIQGGIPVIIASVLFILFGAVVMNLITAELELQNNLTDLFIAMAHTVPGFLAVSLVGPIAEEMLFRGAIQRTLHDKGFHPWRAIGISSLLFGLIHANPAQIPFAIVLGVMFGWIYYRTGSLMPVILGHVANNTIACLLMVALSDDNQELNDLISWPWLGVIFVGGLAATIALGVFLHKKMGKEP